MVSEWGYYHVVVTTTHNSRTLSVEMKISTQVFESIEPDGGAHFFDQARRLMKTEMLLDDERRVVEQRRKDDAKDHDLDRLIADADADVSLKAAQAPRPRWQPGQHSYQGRRQDADDPSKLG
jgi:hypothetical protein